MRTPRTLAVAAAAAFLGGAAGTGVAIGLGDHGSSSTTNTTVQAVTPASDGAMLSARDIYRHAAPSVAFITAQASQGTATGTGFVVDADGFIVTNNHVIDGANAITVKFGGGKGQTAKVIGTDPSTDLALLKVDTGGGKLTPLKLADSSKVQIGDPTFAIGNPFGLEDTLTTGVISATERDISAPNGFSISGVLQTDAALNPGNSGGPLLNAHGQVIGVNSQIETGGGGGGGPGSNTGVGFAIPSNTVRNVISQLQETGKVSHAYLGVSTSDAARGGGATVQSVAPGGPAAHAGLKTGTTIVGVDAMTVVSANGLTNAIDAHKPGDTVKLRVRSGGKIQTLTVKLGQRPASVG